MLLGSDPTLTHVLVYGFVIFLLCGIALAMRVARGPRKRPGMLMSIVIVVAVVWRLSDFLH